MTDLKDFSEQFEKWWLTKFSAEFLDSDNCWSAWTGWQARGALDAVRVKEPIGYVDEFGNFEFTMQMWMEEEPNVTWTPVYTTPPSREWVGLSDAEIEEAVNCLNVKIDYPIMFARLIEMHLKEKNNE